MAYKSGKTFDKRWLKIESLPEMRPPRHLNGRNPIPVLAEPKLIIRALERLRLLKSSNSADAVNTTTSPHLPGYVSAAFGSLDQPWKPSYLRSAYGAICCHIFKPRNQTDDIFLAQIHLLPLSPDQYSGLIGLLEIFAQQLSLMANQMMIQDAEAEAPMIRRARAYISLIRSPLMMLRAHCM